MGRRTGYKGNYTSLTQSNKQWQKVERKYHGDRNKEREEPSPKDVLKAKRKKKLQKQSRKKNRR